jgi:multimeric flavodoxin WrbA
MQLLAICGSRNPEGQTGRALAEVLAGAGEAGSTAETHYLPQRHIEVCRQCDDDGWGECRGGVSCVIDDDLAALMEAVREADAVVFATPVYFGDLSESLKAFLDRFRRVAFQGAARDRIQGTPAVGLCVAGGGGGGAPRCAQLLESTLQTCGFDVVDMIPARRQNLAMKRAVLRSAGRWLATGPRSA